jgi:small neutral amino acid transporter SnatA (MarC family)
VTTGREGGRPGMLRPLLLTFIPLFVAVDVVGLVVIYLGIALPFDEPDRRRLVGGPR